MQENSGGGRSSPAGSNHSTDNSPDDRDHVPNHSGSPDDRDERHAVENHPRAGSDSAIEHVYGQGGLYARDIPAPHLGGSMSENAIRGAVQHYAQQLMERAGLSPEDAAKAGEIAGSNIDGEKVEVSVATLEKISKALEGYHSAVFSGGAIADPAIAGALEAAERVLGVIGAVTAGALTAIEEHYGSNHRSWPGSVFVGGITTVGALDGAFLGGGLGALIVGVLGIVNPVLGGAILAAFAGGGAYAGGALGHNSAGHVADDLGLPLVLDLDGDGIELVAPEDSNAFFNYGMSDAKAAEFTKVGDMVVRTGWVKPDDGILVVDFQGDGKITDASEIVLTKWLAGAKTDLEGLSGLDDNKDGKIDAKDMVWGKLKILRDLNGNGIADAGEMFALSAFGIAFINLKGDGNASVQDGNLVAQHTTWGDESGVLHSLGDVGFGFELREYERAMVQNGAPSSLPRRAEEEVRAHQLHDLPPVPNAGPAPLPVTRPAQVVREEAAKNDPASAEVESVVNFY